MDKAIKNLLVGLVLVCLLGPSVSFGSVTSGQAQHGHHKVKSPFSDKSEKMRMHCLLKGHRLNKPCPEHIKRNSGSSEKCLITSPCNDGSSPLTPPNPVTDWFQSAEWQDGFLSPYKAYVPLSSPQWTFRISVSLEHPPKFLSL